MKSSGLDVLPAPGSQERVPTVTLVVSLALLVIGILWAVAVFEVVQSRAAIRQDMGLQKLGWREMAWPFPRDGWPGGRAFRCNAASCGEGSELYIRAKMGLCNSDTGVAGDEEVDRVTDIDLVGLRPTPSASGQTARFGEFAGRSRSYALDLANGSRVSAIGYALSRRSDMIVAVVKGSGPEPLLQQAADQFLAANDVQRWMVGALGAR
jgi:hypothetical protein